MKVEFKFNVALRPQRPHGLLIIRTVGRGDQDGHTNFHTDPELCESRGGRLLLPSCFTSTETIYGLLGTGEEWDKAELRSCVKVEVAVLCESRGGRPV